MMPGGCAGCQTDRVRRRKCRKENVDSSATDRYIGARGREEKVKVKHGEGKKKNQENKRGVR